MTEGEYIQNAQEIRAAIDREVVELIQATAASLAALENRLTSWERYQRGLWSIESAVDQATEWMDGTILPRLQEATQKAYVKILYERDDYPTRTSR